MKFKINLKTHIARFLILCLAFCLMGSTIYQYQKNRIVEPSEWYFITTESDSIDINSPTKRYIIVMLSKKYDNNLKDCDFTRFADLGISPLGAYYKGISLCNSTSFSEEDFKVRNLYFREKVDELWNDYYKEHIENVFLGILTGITAWLSILCIVFLSKWVAQGK